MSDLSPIFLAYNEFVFKNGSTEIFETLVTSGLYDLNDHDEWGETVLNKLMSDFRQNVSPYLAKHFRQLLDILLTNGADPNVRNRSESPNGKPTWLPLHYAMIINDEDVIKTLLEHGADVNALGVKTWASDSSKMTMLDYYLKTRKINDQSREMKQEVVDLLKKYGAKTFKELHPNG